MDMSVVRVVVTLLFTGMYMVIDVYMCIYMYPQSTPLFT